MSDLNVDITDFVGKTSKLTEEMLDAAEKAMHDAVDDLVRISSNIAPIEKDILRKSHIQEVTRGDGSVVGEVAYSVSEADGKGRFNYALAMHEWVYQAKQGGSYEGYFVGRKYLERPLLQEGEKYVKWIAQDIKGAIE